MNLSTVYGFKFMFDILLDFYYSWVILYSAIKLVYGFKFNAGFLESLGLLTTLILLDFVSISRLVVFFLENLAWTRSCVLLFCKGCYTLCLSGVSVMWLLYYDFSYVIFASSV